MNNFGDCAGEGIIQFPWEQKSRQLGSVPSESKACLELTEEQGIVPGELIHATKCNFYFICIKVLKIEE